MYLTYIVPYSLAVPTSGSSRKLNTLICGLREILICRLLAVKDVDVYMFNLHSDIKSTSTVLKHNIEILVCTTKYSVVVVM